MHLLNSNLFRLVGAKGQRRGEGRGGGEQHLLQTLCQQVQQASCSSSCRPRERTSSEVATVRTFLLPLNSRQGEREADDLQGRCGCGFSGGRRGGALLGVRKHRPQHLWQSEGQDSKISGEIRQQSLAKSDSSKFAGAFFDELDPCLTGQQGSCSSAVELSENILQTS